MTSGMYLIQHNDQLVEMREQSYNSEELLQELLEKYPNLLAGDQINSTEPRRWLLISREMGLPSEEAGSDRWSVDHLYLDQDAIPTLVEVKRSSDTRIRREVVGQMLDYAANAIIYWPVETLRAKFEARCEAQGSDVEQELYDLLGVGADREHFWQQAKTNLQAGKVRMLFVADIIPHELRRIVEFLNRQMNPAEVLAVEIRQFVGGNMRTLVPRVIGQTADTELTKSGRIREGKQWDEASFFFDLETKKGTVDVTVARNILEWSKARNLRIWWGKGKQHGSFFPILDYNDVTYSLFAVWTNGGVELQFQWMKPPFEVEQKRMELLHRLNAIEGISIPPDRIRKRPSFALSLLQDATKVQQFVDTFDWVIQEIKSS